MKKLLILALTLIGTNYAHATWDVTTPAGTEAKSLGDDRIREFKTDVQTALQFGGDFPGADTASPRFFYTPSTGTTSGRPTGNDRATGMLYVNKTSGTIEQYSGSGWDVIGYKNGFPTGTKMPFFQAACPDGWTQDTSYGGQVLRSTNSAGGGTGGSADVSTATFSHSHTVDAHTHDLGNHTHSTPNHQHQQDYDTSSVDAANSTTHITSTAGDGQRLFTDSGAAGSLGRWYKNQTQNSGSGTSGTPSTNTSGSTAPGTDTQGLPSLKYMNVIICTAP